MVEHPDSNPSPDDESDVDKFAALADAPVTALGLSSSEADALEQAYRFCERARNLRYLLTGTPGNSLPTDGSEAERLAVLLGYTHRPVTGLREDYRRLTRRSRAVVERVFYGRP